MPDKCLRFLACLWAFCLILTGGCSTTSPLPVSDDPVIIKADRALYENIQAHTLPNGLRVYLKPIPGSPTVTTMVAYRVGSADEDNNATGLSHYLEHLMFKGTDQFMPGDIDRLTQRNGGANNAYTTTDYTAYHFDFAADRWEWALEIESNRMRNLRIDPRHEFEHEKGAVIQELAQDEDLPWDIEQKTILPLLFGPGPYGHPVIGQVQHVRAATPSVIKEYYDRWYQPNNAVLVVVGGFDPAQALAKIQELFGPIPSQPLPARAAEPPPPRDGPVVREFNSKFTVPRMLMGFNGVKQGDPNDAVLDVVCQILAGGKTGRLYRRLVEEQKLANQVDAYSIAGRYPGWTSISVELLPDKDRADVEQAVLEELQKLASEPVTPDELERAQRCITASQIFSHESNHNLADSIAYAAATTDIAYLHRYLPAVESVTPHQVMNAAKTYLNPQKRVVVWSVPKPGAEMGGSGSPPANRLPAPDRAQRQNAAPKPWLRAASSSSPVPSSGATYFNLKKARRVVLPSGLTLVLLENHRLPIVVVDAEVRNVRLYEPPESAGLAELLGRMLDQGTRGRSGRQIAAEIESVGGKLAMRPNGGSVAVLTPDLPRGLNILLDCLTESIFPEEPFEREKQRQLSDIEDQETQPPTRAARELAAMIYGDHPLGHPALGTRASVKKLTPRDCDEFRRSIFLPINTVIAIVGDFNSDQVVENITQLTRSWNVYPMPAMYDGEIKLVDPPAPRYVSLPDAAQTQLMMGHLGIRRENPDYYKLLVMDYVFGTGTGFTDRLSARIRDREGLAYSVGASITESAGREPGIFRFSVGADAANIPRVSELFHQEFARLLDSLPADREVADAKAFLTGTLPFQVSTCHRVASTILYIERNKLGYNYLDDYRKAVQAVKPSDVRNVAQRYLVPSKLCTVIVGAVDAQGKLLQPPPPPPEEKP